MDAQLREVLLQVLKVLGGCLEHPDADDAIAAVEVLLIEPNLTNVRSKGEIT